VPPLTPHPKIGTQQPRNPTCCPPSARDTLPPGSSPSGRQQPTNSTRSQAEAPARGASCASTFGSRARSPSRAPLTSCATSSRRPSSRPRRSSWAAAARGRIEAASPLPSPRPSPAQPTTAAGPVRRVMAWALGVVQCRKKLALCTFDNTHDFAELFAPRKNAPRKTGSIPPELWSKASLPRHQLTMFSRFEKKKVLFSVRLQLVQLPPTLPARFSHSCIPGCNPRSDVRM